MGYKVGDIVKINPIYSKFANKNNVNVEYEIVEVINGGKKYRIQKKGGNYRTAIGPIAEKELMEAL